MFGGLPEETTPTTALTHIIIPTIYIATSHSIPWVCKPAAIQLCATLPLPSCKRSSFRQLERAKEMREERELFRLLYETVRLNPATIKLRPCLLFMQKDVESKETPVLANLWSKDTIKHRVIIFDDEHSDVDTSLHL